MLFLWGLVQEMATGIRGERSWTSDELRLWKEPLEAGVGQWGDTWRVSLGHAAVSNSWEILGWRRQGTSPGAPDTSERCSPLSDTNLRQIFLLTIPEPLKTHSDTSAHLWLFSNYFLLFKHFSIFCLIGERPYSSMFCPINHTVRASMPYLWN